MATDLDRLMADFGQSLGIPELALDESGGAALQIDDVVLNLEADDDGRTLVVFADVGAPPRRGEASDEFYETLLKANFLHLGMGGATLGMDREAGFIALVDRVPVTGTGSAEFAERIERLVNLAEAWTERIAELSAATKELEVPPAGSSDMLRI